MGKCLLAKRATKALMATAYGLINNCVKWLKGFLTISDCGCPWWCRDCGKQVYLGKYVVAFVVHWCIFYYGFLIMFCYVYKLGGKQECIVGKIVREMTDEIVLSG